MNRLTRSLFATVFAVLVGGCSAFQKEYTPLEAVLPQEARDASNTNRAVDWGHFAVVTDPQFVQCTTTGDLDCGVFARQTEETVVGLLAQAGLDVFQMRNAGDWRQFGRPHHLLDIRIAEVNSCGDRSELCSSDVTVTVRLLERVDPRRDFTRQVAVFTGRDEERAFTSGFMSYFTDHNGEQTRIRGPQQAHQLLSTAALDEAVRRLHIGDVKMVKGKMEVPRDKQFVTYLYRYAHDGQQQGIADAVSERQARELSELATTSRTTVPPIAQRDPALGEYQSRQLQEELRRKQLEGAVREQERLNQGAAPPPQDPDTIIVAPEGMHWQTIKLPSGKEVRMLVKGPPVGLNGEPMQLVDGSNPAYEDGLNEETKALLRRKAALEKEVYALGERLTQLNKRAVATKNPALKDEVSQGERELVELNNQLADVNDALAHTPVPEAVEP